jgi:formate dehydrogenase iron-sulfur subunit
MNTSTLATDRTNGSLVDSESLIDRLLAEQGNLTAVERFSEVHDRGGVPALEPWYRELIPLTRPGPGEQYAFEVNLDKCTSCKACVSACHSLNGLEENETWRDVGLLLGNFDNGGYQQTVTTACHHCDDPACANGCPVLAYDKDPETGIVRHLDDQCIGCQYCSLKCPYDVPKYSKSLGIVRKCDMCHSRLAVGEAPACVQACPTSAIRIVTTTESEIRARTEMDGAKLLPATVASSYTRPSTRYVTERSIPEDARPANARQPKLEHSHLPLVNMLTFTQIGVGLLIGYAILSFFSGYATFGVGIAGTGALLLGLGASVLHLGQPLKAWRVFLGLRKSWLSREVVTFGGVPPLALGALVFPQYLAIPAVLMGLAGVFTSVMVYADTQRVLWSFRRTALRFFGTTALFAAAGLSFGENAVRWPALAAVVAVLGVKLTREILFLKNAHAGDDAPDTLSAQLLTGNAGRMRQIGIARFALAGLGLAILFTGFVPAMVVGVACLAASEWIERYQFFRTVVAYRMPGGI